jgi:predicted ATPase
VIEHFKRLARRQDADDAPARLAKLEAMLGRFGGPLGESVPLMASLLSLQVPQERYPALALSPQEQKQQTQDMITGITMEVAEGSPFLQLWEDLHWADPSTLDIIGLLIEQAPTASLLIVTSARPELTRSWPTRSHITPITLSRLERPATEALITHLAGSKPLPDEVVGHIVTKTDGVPLYVEELTETILASNILKDAGERYELAGPLSSLSIPDTLQESLMARLDRLPKVRELAPLGSVLARGFTHEMITGLVTTGDTELQHGLEQLVATELLYQRGRPPHTRYIFKHALVQDAAYASLLRRARQKFHQQVAEVLEAKFPELTDDQPELLAHHYGEADLADRAINYLHKAGQRSVLRSADEEVITHLSKGLELISRDVAHPGTGPPRAEHANHVRNCPGRCEGVFRA